MKSKYSLALCASILGMVIASRPAVAAAPLKVGAICFAVHSANELERLSYQAFSNSVCGQYPNRVIITRSLNRSGDRRPWNDEIERIRTILSKVDRVDLFIWGHTNWAADWLPAVFENRSRAQLRLVYNSGCDDGRLQDGEKWIKVARAFVGHPGTNYGPHYAPIFVKHWLRGKDVSTAVDRSNKAISWVEAYYKQNDPNGYVFGDARVSIRN